VKAASHAVVGGGVWKAVVGTARQVGGRPRHGSAGMGACRVRATGSERQGYAVRQAPRLPRFTPACRAAGRYEAAHVLVVAYGTVITASPAGAGNRRCLNVTAYGERALTPCRCCRGGGRLLPAQRAPRVSTQKRSETMGKRRRAGRRMSRTALSARQCLVVVVGRNCGGGSRGRGSGNLAWRGYGEGWVKSAGTGGGGGGV